MLERGRLQMPLYIRAAAELLGRDVVGGLYQSVKGDEAPRGLLREDVREAGALEGFAGRDYVEPELFEQLLDEAAERAGEFAGRMKVGDVLHDPPDGECPAVVPLARRLPGGEPVSAVVALSEQQRAAVEARGEIVVAAGAGTGKTTLVIERVRAALEAGTAPERVLVVTYTEAAARELAVRLERALPAGADAARPQVGTIHALAARLLREYAAEAGLPAELRVLDEAEALVLSEAAFADAIARERRDGPSVAARPARRVRRRRLARADPQPRRAPARGRGAGAAAAAGARRARSCSRRCARRPRRPPRPSPATTRPQAASDLRRLARIEALLAGDAERSRAARARGAQGRGRRRRGGAARAPRRRRRARASSTRSERPVAALLERYREAYRARKEAELALDFDDLQERACELLERDDDRRGRARALRPRARRRVPGHERPAVPPARRARRAGLRSASSSATPASPSTASATPTWSSSARAASAAAARLPLTGSYRSRPELLAVIGHVFGRALRRARLRSAARAAHGRADGRARRSSCTSSRAARATLRAGAARELEAVALARRLRELVDGGGVAAGDIAILLRSARDASIYAAALERVGLAAHSQLGRGFYRSQQVRDLCAYLALLRNRFDDHALLVVLASPLVGVSNDGLAALRTAAQARALLADRARAAGRAARSAIARSWSASRSSTTASCARAASSGSRRCSSASSPSTTTSSPA